MYPYYTANYTNHNRKSDKKYKDIAHSFDMSEQPRESFESFQTKNAQAVSAERFSLVLNFIIQIQVKQHLYTFH